jgi:predicted nucleic acid-binding protein
MRIVLDANIVIMALLGSRATITIITSQNHSLYVPTKIIDEINKHKILVCRKIDITKEEFKINLNSLFKFITLIQYVEYEPWIKKSKIALNERDNSDIDYLACALSINADFIWTLDKDFTEQKLIPIKSTAQFIEEQKS